MIKLKCGCSVKDDGKFAVGEKCRHCAECNAVSKIHPFGDKRLDDLGLHNHEH